MVHGHLRGRRLASASPAEEAPAVFMRAHIHGTQFKPGEEGASARALVGFLGASVSSSAK